MQLLRCDPTRATGFAPAELMLGRKLFYPVEFSTSEIDYTGTTMTTPLVQSLIAIRGSNFRTATKKIKKAQATYKKQYDKRMNAKPFRIKVGEKVQYQRHKSRSVLSKNELTLWCPVRTYHIVASINFERKNVILRTKEGQILQKSHPFSRIRKFRGQN